MVFSWHHVQTWMDVNKLKFPNRKCAHKKCKHLTPKLGKWCRKHVPKTFSGLFDQTYSKVLPKAFDELSKRSDRLLELIGDSGEKTVWNTPIVIEFPKFEVDEQ